MTSVSFTIIHQDKATKARVGEIHTPHGVVQTPQFFPVGTQASVKALTPRDLRDMGAQLVLANTYHLHLRPGEDIIDEFGGVAEFMGWHGPTMTDSGGFQVFSLGVNLEHGMVKFLKEEEAVHEKEAKPRLNKISEEGVLFQSHLDGSSHMLSPESSIAIQEKIGADLIVGFDDLESPLYDYDKTRESLELTERWLTRSLAAQTRTDQLLYGVTHGGKFEDLRLQSAKFVDEHFQAVALGGAHASKQNLYEVVDWTTSHISLEKPRHLLGIGDIDDIFEGVERGVDTFDCVTPTRLGRMGVFFVHGPTGTKENRWRQDITKADYTHSHEPLDATCSCMVCKTYTRGYIHHLFRAHELEGYTLVSYHNIAFLMNLMKEIREAIQDDRFTLLKKDWMGV